MSKMPQGKGGVVVLPHMAEQGAYMGTPMGVGGVAGSSQPLLGQAPLHLPGIDIT